MCGIVGYYGKKDTTQVLLGGLKKLEYRGYDSSGIAILNGGAFDVVRAEGKLGNLENKLREHPLKGPLGIAHTRWATHGIPSERNAHPHQVEGVCLVHNGIIENYSELKEELTKLGAKFSSDTDSEVVAHLVARQLKVTPDLLTSVQKVLPRLHGAYAILMVWDKQPDTLVAFKNGPPLLVGIGDGESVVGSDVQAILPYTKDVVYLEDHEIAHICKNKAQFYSGDGKLLDKKPVRINWTAQQSEKMGYKHWMLKEIFEQPKSVASILKRYVDISTLSVKLESMVDCPMESSKKDFDLNFLKTAERIFVVGCGTSFYSAMYSKYLLEKMAGVPVETDIASEFRYREPVIPKNSLVIVISQSGETADTLAVVRLAKDSGAKVLSLTNTRGSTIDRESHGHLYMEAGVEIGVASTKAFTNTLAALNLFTIFLGRLRGKITAADEKKHVQNLLSLPAQMEAVLAYDKFFSETAIKFKDYRGFLYLGRGVSYPLAMEGALKVKELAYMHAEGYAAGEMKHGPLALIDDKMLVIVICPQDMHYEKTLSNLQEAKARGGIIVSIGTGEDRKLREMSKDYLSLPRHDWMVSGLLSVIPVQLLAYHVADVLGYDVDQPRNLAKSVTVE